MNALKKLGVLLAVMMVATMAFSGTVAADATNTNSQTNVQTNSAGVVQYQDSSATGLLAGIDASSDDQKAVVYQSNKNYQKQWNYQDANDCDWTFGSVCYN
jgi:endonuclease I